MYGAISFIDLPLGEFDEIVLRREDISGELRPRDISFRASTYTIVIYRQRVSDTKI